MEMFKFWVKKEKETADYGRFVISPLPQGFGHTLGNALRRVLLGYMPGAAITRIKVKGANHPFALLKGVKEDLIDVIMNIKQIRISYEGEKAVKLHLEKKGPGEVRAQDIKLAPGVKIGNPDLVIAHLADKKSTLKIDFTVERGIGYSLADDHKTEKMSTIAVDAIFSPVTRANYEVSDIRVGKQKNMNELVVEIWTDSTISPSAALKQAAEILVHSFSLIVNPVKKKEGATKTEKRNSNLGLWLEELDLPIRLINALKKAGFKKLADFEGKKKADLLKVKNVGEKSFQLLLAALKKRGVHLSE